MKKKVDLLKKVDLTELPVELLDSVDLPGCPVDLLESGQPVEVTYRSTDVRYVDVSKVPAEQIKPYLEQIKNEIRLRLLLVGSC